MLARFNFSFKTTLVCFFLAALMVRASFWQYDRLLQKNALITTLTERLQETPTPLSDQISQLESKGIPSVIHKRVIVEGTYDFNHQMILRNRRCLGMPGALIITPLRIESLNTSILVNRGFIPIKESTSIEKFNTLPTATFVGLLKESMTKKFLAPPDPEVGGINPFQTQWIRVNIPEMQKQIPYPLLPLWVEVMNPGSTPSDIKKSIITPSTAGREDMLFLPGGDAKKILSDSDVPQLEYPIPCYDTVIPPGRHQEYVYEWAAMAILTIIIGIVLQFRRPQIKNKAT